MNRSKHESLGQLPKISDAKPRAVSLAENHDVAIGKVKWIMLSKRGNESSGNTKEVVGRDV